MLCPIVDCEGFAKKARVADQLLTENNDLKTRLLEYNQYDSVLNVSKVDKVKVNYTCNIGHNFCSRCMKIWHGETDCDEDKEIKDFDTNSGHVVKKCPECKV